MAAPTKLTFNSHAQRQEYGWRAFCLEFLYGLVVVAWYLLALAEMTTFKGLSRLEKLAAITPGDTPSGDG